MNEIGYFHEQEFGCDPEVVVSAPGTIDIIGDLGYQEDGMSVQIALDRYLSVAISRRKDVSLRFFSADLNERKRTTLPNLKYRREDRWANYPKGVINEVVQLGYELSGMDLTIKSDIPPGIGLGASAALGVATAVGVAAVNELRLGDFQIIQSASMAESSFMSIDSTITDQFTTTIAKEDKGVFLDLSTLNYEYLPVKLGEAKLLLTISNVPLVPAVEELQERKDRVAECVEFLRQRKGTPSLRELSTEDLNSSMGIVPEDMRRLCLHVLQERERAIDARNFLESGDVTTLGKLLTRSHESQRDNYEISCPEIDWLVKRTGEIDGIYGSRMIGQGFGGCTLSLVKETSIPRYVERLDEYERIFGFRPETLICHPADGVELLTQPTARVG